ncbi:MAG TPA: hypothetical protein PL004_05995 [Bacillota bacterium]|nr:hypothetical protein [Bacillota bacterium]
MEYILELDEDRQLRLPQKALEELELKSGSKFVARVNAGKLIIENLPFSALEQGEALNQTIESLQKE